jgi:Predicted transcriptional regulators
MQNELPAIVLDPAPVHAGELSISDMARLYGVSLRTLRFYEDKGMLQPRRQATARYYGARDRLRLELILKGKRLGFTLAEIYDLIESRERPGPQAVRFDERADLTVSLDKSQIAAQIAHLERQRAELEVAIEELRNAHARMDEPVV